MRSKQDCSFGGIINNRRAFARYRGIDEDMKRDLVSLLEWNRGIVYNIVQFLLKIALTLVQFVIFAARNNVQKIWMRYCKLSEFSWT